MRIHRRIVEGLLLSSLSVTPFALVAQTATQVVTFSVVSSSQVAIGNLTSPAHVEAPSMGQNRRTVATVAGTTYGVATNEKNQKIIASVGADVPRSAALSVALGAPRGAVSRGMRALSTTPTDVVTGITGADGQPLPVTYRWKGASMAPLRNRIVTYTITAGL